jgi:opine dehydrogenase
MQLSVIGAGNLGFALAAYLCHHGHDVTIWSPSGTSTSELAAGQPLRYGGVLEGTATPYVGHTLASSIHAAEAIIVALPGNAHADVLARLGRCMSAGQAVMICSLISASALVLDRELAARGIESTIVALSSTPVTARKVSGSEVRITAIRDRLDMAVLPVRRSEQALALCSELFGERFAINGDILAMSLGNNNPVAHSALALCNLTRMERAESWPQYHYMTPYTSRLIEAMDRERREVALAWGVDVRSVEMHFHQSFGIPVSDVATMAAEIHRRRGGPPGPTDPENRYVLEDVPFGLVFVAAIARIVGVPVPVTESVITVAGSLYGRAFELENDLLPQLALEKLSASDLRGLVTDGYPRG